MAPRANACTVRATKRGAPPKPCAFLLIAAKPECGAMAVLSRRAAANHRRGARCCYERALFRRRLRFRQVREVFGVRLKIREEALELLLHRVHLLSHI